MKRTCTIKRESLRGYFSWSNRTCNDVDVDLAGQLHASGVHNINSAIVKFEKCRSDKKIGVRCSVGYFDYTTI